MAIKYKWLSSQLKEQIKKNMKYGIQKLPSEQAICQKYDVSRQTVRQALTLLESQGLITKKKGSGSYITGLSPDSSQNIIDIMISNDQEYIYPELLNDIQQVISPYGFQIRIHRTNNQIYTEHSILLELLKNPPGGLIVEACKSSLPNPNLSLYRKLMEQGTSIVFILNHYPDLKDCIYIKDDNRAGSSMLVSHLISQGHTAIGGLFKIDDLQGIERYRGFLEAMAQYDFLVPDHRICWYDSRQLNSLIKEKDTVFFNKILKETFHDCSAIICHNDQIAYYLAKEMQLLGYRLPEEIAIASFDNSYLSDFGSFSITTLSHKSHETGTLTARTMLNILKGLPARPQEIPWKLIIKESTRYKNES